MAVIRFQVKEYIVIFARNTNNGPAGVPSQGQIILQNPGGPGPNVVFYAVRDADLPNARKYLQNGPYFPVGHWEYERILDTVRNESPVHIAAADDRDTIYYDVRTGKEPAGEGDV